MRTYLLTVLLAWTCAACAVSEDQEKLYRQIDEAIDHSPEYVAAYEQKINLTREEYDRATTAEEKCRLALALYEQYKAFLNDSALLYLDRAEHAALQMRSSQKVCDIRSMKAFQCSTVGLYHEALTILGTVDKQQLDTLGLTHYYMALMHVYGELGYYTQVNAMRDTYYERQALYRDSLYAVIDHESQDYMMRRILELKGKNQLSEAKTLSDKMLKTAKPDTRDYAIASYYRWLITDAKSPDFCYWLCQSSLCDIRNAVMDQASLLSLAEQLNADGNLDRSYRYIRFTWDCNNRFNTRMRSWQITPILNLIERNYQGAVKHNTKVLTTSIIAVSTLALLLLAALFFVHRRNKQLAVARNALRDSNDQLSSANSRLSIVNSQLSIQRDELSTLNSQLSESNQVKEEYIGRFMSLCSQYIDKLDDYRKMVNKKMKNKELDELFRISRSTELKDRELEELYENFDSVFLHLFPTFVSEFNALLQPEAQIHPKADNRLSTEIRIFALIRLGIDDSSKIAEFLHYSVNTIYNYRARIKNGALDNRERFEQRVKELCRIR